MKKNFWAGLGVTILCSILMIVLGILTAELGIIFLKIVFLGWLILLVSGCVWRWHTDKRRCGWIWAKGIW